MRRFFAVASIVTAVLAGCGTLVGASDDPSAAADASMDGPPEGSVPPGQPPPTIDCGDPHALCDDFEKTSPSLTDGGDGLGPWNFQSRTPASVTLQTGTPPGGANKALQSKVVNADQVIQKPSEATLGWKGAAGAKNVVCDFQLLVKNEPIAEAHPNVFALEFDGPVSTIVGIAVNDREVVLRRDADTYVAFAKLEKDKFVPVHFEYDANANVAFGWYGDTRGQPQKTKPLDVDSGIRDLIVGLSDLFSPSADDNDIWIDDVHCLAK